MVDEDAAAKVIESIKGICARCKGGSFALRWIKGLGWLCPLCRRRGPGKIGRTSV